MILCEIHNDTPAESHITWGASPHQKANLCKPCIEELWDRTSHGHIGVWIQLPPKVNKENP